MTPTIDQLYQTFQGTSIPSFDGDPDNNGQCVQWALVVRTKRDGLNIRYGNAVDWWDNPDGDEKYYDYIPYEIGVYPQKGDYVIWGAGVGSRYGHIDVCAEDGDEDGFLGYDSNWGDVPILKTVQHNYQFGLLGFIRKKGQDDMKISTAEEVNLLWQLNGINRAPTQEEVQDALGRDLDDYVGNLLKTAPFKANLAKVKFYDNDVQDLQNKVGVLEGSTNPKMVALADAIKNLVKG